MSNISIYVVCLIFATSVARAQDANEQPASDEAASIPAELAALSPNTGDPHVNFLIALANRESGGRPGIINPFGYLGLFQMGGGALVDARFYTLGPSKQENAWDGSFSKRAGFVGVTSKITYLQSAGAQELAVRAYHDIQWSRIEKLGLSSSVGMTYAGVKLTTSGMIAGSHLVGVGALAKFIRSQGSFIPVDGNKTPITQYISMFGGYF